MVTTNLRFRHFMKNVYYRQVLCTHFRWYHSVLYNKYNSCRNAHFIDLDISNAYEEHVLVRLNIRTHFSCVVTGWLGRHHVLRPRRSGRGSSTDRKLQRMAALILYLFSPTRGLFCAQHVRGSSCWKLPQVPRRTGAWGESFASCRTGTQTWEASKT